MGTAKDLQERVVAPSSMGAGVVALMASEAASQKAELVVVMALEVEHLGLAVVVRLGPAVVVRLGLAVVERLEPAVVRRSMPPAFS
jgi:hypothetical protein